MNSYMVRYFNGRSTREKFFKCKNEAEAFIKFCDDLKAELWVKAD